MSNPITSGQISFADIANHLGYSLSNLKLSGINTSHPFTFNQIFFSYNGYNPLSNTVSLNSFKGKRFALHTNSSRTNEHTDIHRDIRFGLFSAYFGFGSSQNGNSSILKPYNRGIPFTIRLTSLNGLTLGYLFVSLRRDTTNTYESLRPSGTSYSFTGNYHFISIYPTRTNINLEFIIEVFPSGSTSASGVHRIECNLLEFEEEFSSSFILR